MSAEVTVSQWVTLGGLIVFTIMIGVILIILVTVVLRSMKFLGGFKSMAANRTKENTIVVNGTFVDEPVRKIQLGTDESWRGNVEVMPRPTIGEDDAP